MKVIGLAGPPGSGKSAVGRRLAERRGVVWIDLDPLAWSVYRTGTEAFVRLVERFGESVRSSDGEIDRSRLAETVFADRAARRDLEAIVHPAVGGALGERIREEEINGTDVVLVEGALLASSPHVDRSLFDAVLWFDAPEDERRRRLRTACREHQLDRLHDVEPAAGTIRVDASGSLIEASARVWKAIAEL